jgi:hypothetical protein
MVAAGFTPRAAAERTRRAVVSITPSLLLAPAALLLGSTLPLPKNRGQHGVR